MGSKRENRNKILEQLVIDCGRFDFNEKESLNYISDRAGGIGIERTQYYAIKKRIKMNEVKNTQSRLIYHSKSGFLIDHFKRIDEAEHLQSILFKTLHNETSKPVEQQSAFAISKIASNIMANSRLLNEMNMCSPIIDQMREYISNSMNMKQQINDTSKDISLSYPPSAIMLPAGLFKTVAESDDRDVNRVF
jgi:hypothetical protein